jgi:hypothetical protein
MTRNLLPLYLATNTAWSVFIALVSQNTAAFWVEAEQGNSYAIKSLFSRETSDQLTAHLFIWNVTILIKLWKLRQWEITSMPCVSSYQKKKGSLCMKLLTFRPLLPLVKILITKTKMSTEHWWNYSDGERRKTVDLHLSGNWLSGTPIIRISLVLRVKFFFFLL